MDKTPFSTSPTPTSLYVTEQLQTTLFKSRFTINQRQGLNCILGDVGLGKSTVMRFLHAEYSAIESVVPTLVTQPDFNSEFALLKAICDDFGIGPKRSYSDQSRVFGTFLVDQYSAGRNVVLFIDEAQKLTDKMLELVRALLNFETNNDKLVQIVLAGQLELRGRLLAEKHKAIRSRLLYPSVLVPLTPAEMQGMIEHRCIVSGIKNPFTAEALNHLYDVTVGVPRKILAVCAMAYEMMNLSGANEVGRIIIEEAARECRLAEEDAVQSDALAEALHE
jgi:general secretion pathway protein A